MAVFRGEGGEIERRPNKPTVVWTTFESEEPEIETWPVLLPDPHQPVDQVMNVEDLSGVWRGKLRNAYAEASITGTVAIALKTMGKASDIESAQALAREIWDARDSTKLTKAD